MAYSVCGNYCLSRQTSRKIQDKAIPQGLLLLVGCSTWKHLSWPSILVKQQTTPLQQLCLVTSIKATIYLLKMFKDVLLSIWRGIFSWNAWDQLSYWLIDAWWDSKEFLAPRTLKNWTAKRSGYAIICFNRHNLQKIIGLLYKYASWARSTVD